MIDIGAESTRPNAVLINQQQEWQRLENILPAIIKLCQSHKVLTSLDTRHWQTAKQALALGINVINDVSGLEDQKMAQLLALSDCKIIINHNLGLPADPTKIIDPEKDIIFEVKKWAEEKILELTRKYQIKKQRLIFDIGIGFGKNAEQSIELIERIEEFRDLDVELYVGHSRKSFLKKFKPANNLEKDLLTAFYTQRLKAKKIDYVRVHNVALNGVSG